MKKSILFAFFLLLAAIGAQAQNITVHGTVLSMTDDEPLIGASVFSETLKSGAATDIDGQFTISVPKGSKLTISYVGYVTATVEAQAEMTIHLTEDSEILDEVVVVGYSSEKKIRSYRFGIRSQDERCVRHSYRQCYSGSSGTCSRYEYHD
ncbi:carboxypeptidase-like regulatory domain-containing protein [uncultured Duncaniella sp.]|uniref:carboxypeptidase-like regulatory domain-containing protein n=1 Tax=uncultured Duncaniella sp. TaxID=2768039 RepID=UPI0025B3D193|nr:carboxypeptidase-like regulatory domain-containing protein [uncultured Duncaniella sp.]